MPDGSADLIRQVAAGDRQAFSALVARWRGPVFRYLRATLPQEAAEDALQETFLGVFRGAASFREEASVQAWIFGVARHQAARQRRRRAGEPARTESLEALGGAAGWGTERPAGLLADALSDHQRVRDALHTLDPEDQEILVLHDLEQLSNPEVAELLGISLAAVKSRVHRARLRLMAALCPEVDHA